MRTLGCLLSLAVSLFAQDPVSPPPDPGCPRYPESLRTAWKASLDREMQFARGAAGRLRAPKTSITIPHTNFIDDILFAQMEADHIPPAPVTTDAEFMRRVYLDITGRIPQPEQVAAFLADSGSGKRARLIDQLLASDAYVSQFTLYLNNRFQVTRAYPSTVSLAGRNLFHNYLRDAIARDRPYNEFVNELLSSSGDAETTAGVNYFVRYFGGVEYNPPQDFWDDTTDVITTQFLGFRTACVSCHNGRRHLENINLYLAARTRSQFWSTSAFLARSVFISRNDGGPHTYLLQDRKYGVYTGAVPATNPGNRPQRYGADVTLPTFVLNGARPASANWRAELATLVTSDRQFARATVNYLWAYLFGHGIVDPPDGWDFSRTDPANPPPDPWPLQNTQPQLLEALTDSFISSNYSIKTLLKTIINSNVYQLSSRYPGKWDASYAVDFARHSPRRLSAEELWDAIAIATQTEQPMNVAGFAAPLLYANQLPDPSEPWDNYNVQSFLSSLGRGNYADVARDSSPSLLGLLFLMNNWDTYQRVSEPNGPYNPVNRASRVSVSTLSDSDAITQVYLATLARYPSASEIATVLAARNNNPRWVWLPRLQWALINKLEFIFNN